MSQEKKYDVFISYSRKDYDEVKVFVDMLKKRIPTIDVWMDLKGITVADEFDEKIISAIDASSYVIFAVSPNSNSIGEGSSKWTKKELVYAKNTDKKVIPVLLNGAKLNSWFLFEFGRTDCIDTTDTPQVEKLIENLSFLTNKPTFEEELRREKLVRKDANIEQAKREALPKGEFQVGDLMYKASEDSGGVTVCKPINKKVTEIHIPSQIQYGIYTYDVDCIGAWAFANNTSLLAINLPNSLKTIGNNAFENCSSLSSLVLPNSIQTIGDEAFKWCSSLKHLEIPSDLERIAKKNFYDYYLRNGIYQNVGDLTSTSVGDFTFDGCSSINLVTLKACSIEEFCKERGNDLLYQLGIVGKRTLKINGVEHPHIIIPLGIKYLGHRSFYNFSSLEGITIPETVEEIDKWTFEGCNSLAVIKYNGTQQQWLSVSKGVGWNKDIPAEVIHCTDGDVKLDRIFRI